MQVLNGKNFANTKYKRVFSFGKKKLIIRLPEKQLQVGFK